MKCGERLEQVGPSFVDRVIFHQFDAARPSPGGIDTCIRGIATYFEGSLAIVGVDAGANVEGRRLGKWERHRFGENNAWFLPVTRLDPGDQSRLVPHSVRLSLGIARYRHRIPEAQWVQAHRMDVALVAQALARGSFSYFIHTQEGGLTGSVSDSYWKRAAAVHRYLEVRTVKKAPHVVVFNESYAAELSNLSESVRFSPTWYDPALIFTSEHCAPRGHDLLWVGRLETPKDPLLAITVFERLVALSPDQPWKLKMVGSGTQLAAVAEAVRALPPNLGTRIELAGRLSPADVSAAMSRARVFLMTSHPGYEGFPRVLVEALASGLPAVTTLGSDTGSLIVDGRNGYVTDRDPSTIARKVLKAAALSEQTARESVRHLSAPEVIRSVYEDLSGVARGSSSG